MVLSEMVSLQHIDYMYWATPKSAEEIVAVILCFMNKFELNWTLLFFLIQVFLAHLLQVYKTMYLCKHLWKTGLF